MVCSVLNEPNEKPQQGASSKLQTDEAVQAHPLTAQLPRIALALIGIGLLIAAYQRVALCWIASGCWCCSVMKGSADTGAAQFVVQVERAAGRFKPSLHSRRARAAHAPLSANTGAIVTSETRQLNAMNTTRRSALHCNVES